MHADLLEVDPLKTGVREEPEAGAQQHRHDVHAKLVDQTDSQKLPGHADATNHLNRLISGGGRCLSDRRLDALRYEP